MPIVGEERLAMEPSVDLGLHPRVKFKLAFQELEGWAD